MDGVLVPLSSVRAAGVLVTDRGKSYDAKELEAVKQQKCIPHALRSINAVLETKQRRARHFGSRLKKLLKEGLDPIRADDGQPVRFFPA